MIVGGAPGTGPHRPSVARPRRHRHTPDVAATPGRRGLEWAAGARPQQRRVDLHNHAPARTSATRYVRPGGSGNTTRMLTRHGGPQEPPRIRRGEVAHFGSYPLETVRTMARIIEEVESDPTAAVPPLRRADRTQPGLLVQATLDIWRTASTPRRWSPSRCPATPSGGWRGCIEAALLIAITPNPALTESARAELGDGARPRRGRRVVRCDGADRRPGGAGVGRIRPR